jgi:hypothetical protein
MVEMSELAAINEIFEKGVFSDGSVDITIELPSEKYQYILSHFREIDRDKTTFIISIGITNFKFVLKT